MKNELRKSKRLTTRDCIANTPAGICRILNLNPEGLLLKCFKEWSFSQDWSLDIYNTAGLSLEHLQVKKIWEKQLDNQEAPSQFSMIVGVAFKKLSYIQKRQINAYIQQLEELARLNDIQCGVPVTQALPLQNV